MAFYETFVMQKYKANSLNGQPEYLLTVTEMIALHRSGSGKVTLNGTSGHMTLTKKQRRDDTDHMMTQGAAQQRGKHMGITAAPPFSPDSSLDFMPFSRA